MVLSCAPTLKTGHFSINWLDGRATVCSIRVKLWWNRNGHAKYHINIRAEAHVLADGPQVQYRRMLRNHLVDKDSHRA